MVVGVVQGEVCLVHFLGIQADAGAGGEGRRECDEAIFRQVEVAHHRLVLNVECCSQVLIDVFAVDTCGVASDGTCALQLHRARAEQIDAAAILGVVAADGDAVEGERAFGADGSAARLGSVAAEGGAADAHRSIAIDAAAIGSSGVVGDGATGHGQRAFVVDAAAELSGGVASDGAARDGHRPVVLDAAAEAVAASCNLVGAVAGDGAAADGQFATLRHIDACALERPAAGNRSVRAAVGDGELAVVLQKNDLPVLVGSRHGAAQRVAVEVEGDGRAVDVQTAIGQRDVGAELHALLVSIH